ncbi:uncharacterized protein LOC124118942 [Haliotis rufescens]|uniref:uncharacterized protein LOC124118942 n=1 Tax=Haliotis rufescens TaxID=6454 RepID=UPI001EAF9F4D|nr:uncharacterized protein LOC124118942 [Haliotis rufescens]
MKMAFSSSVWIVFIVTCMSGVSHGAKEISVPKDIPKDIYCIGCEYTVKALDNLLKVRSESDTLDIQVAEAIEAVCDKNHFSGAEVSADSLLKACKFLTDTHQDILEPLLVGHYSRTYMATYLDLSQQVCIDLSMACVDVAGKKRFPKHLESDLEFDPEMQSFKVKPGRNLRIPEPVEAGREDL